MRPRGIGRFAVRAIMRVDVGIIPHVERARGAGTDRDASSAMKASTGMDLAGRGDSPTSAVKTTSDITRGFSSAK